ncbi:MAG: hypothetical protein QM729_16395 [Solirubrobacterales bacterium]
MTTSGRRPASFAPGDFGGRQAGIAGDVLAARDGDHLGYPEARDADRLVEALERDHPRHRRPRDGRAHGRQAALEFPAELVRGLARTGRLAETDDLFQHLV